MQELQYGVIGIQTRFAHEVRQIVAGGETIALSLYQQHVYGVILCRLPQCLSERTIHVGIEGIALVGAIEGQGEQAILLLGNDNGVHV